MSSRSREALSRKCIVAGLVIAIGAFAFGVADTALPRGNTGCAERMQERLFFGLNGPQGAIDDAEWEAFIESVVTPRFPAGLTIVQATGQWQGRDKSITRESSRVVEIIHDDSNGASRRVAEIASEYKIRFHQESVLVARARIQVCL
jgi:hypothetical protein